MPYHLFQSLRGHTSAIRAISHCGETADILSAGRDLWAKTWQYSPEAGYHVVSNFAGHKDFISCATYVPPSEHYPSGLCVTGGYDKNVIIFTPDTEELVATISSLSSAVTALHVIDNTLLIVACSDGAVSLYKISYLYENVELAAIQHFTGHSLPVWAVIFTAGYIITGCADKAIRVFDKGGTLFRKLEGHTDCVRAMASLHHSDQFLSGGNDGVIRRWSALKDNCLQTYDVHSNSIYSIAVSPDNLFFTSCGEDSEVYVCYNAFTDGEVEIEKINHPSQSVWSIMVLPNNDIVTGSCDGQVRVFSQNPERKANGDALVFFNQEIADTEKARKSGGQTSGGTNQTPATNGSHQPKATNSNELVFYIDIDDSKPALPLHYRKGEDEYAVARAFLEKHNISLVYLENIVEFIRKNAPIAMPVSADTESYVDPFTGGSRYIPEGERGDRQSDSASQRSEEQNKSSASTTDFSAYFPQKDYVISEVANVPKIKEKALELCSSMPGDIDAEGILKVMTLVTSDGNPSEDSIESLMKLLSWPENSIFPVLDIMRLVIRKNATNKVICSGVNGEKLMQQLLKLTANNSLPVNKMLSYRILSNMLLHQDGRALYLKHKDLIYSNLKLAVDDSSTKQLQVAAATFFLNLSVLYTKKFDKNEITRCMDTVEDLLRFFKDDEAVFRIVVSLGTLMIFNSTKQLRKTSRDYLSLQLSNNKIDKVLTVCGLLVARINSSNN